MIYTGEKKSRISFVVHSSKYAVVIAKLNTIIKVNGMQANNSWQSTEHLMLLLWLCLCFWGTVIFGWMLGLILVINVWFAVTRREDFGIFAHFGSFGTILFIVINEQMWWGIR